jgi:hypothetical protein
MLNDLMHAMQQQCMVALSLYEYNTVSMVFGSPVLGKDKGWSREQDI